MRPATAASTVLAALLLALGAAGAEEASSGEPTIDELLARCEAELARSGATVPQNVKWVTLERVQKDAISAVREQIKRLRRSGQDLEVGALCQRLQDFAGALEAYSSYARQHVNKDSDEIKRGWVFLRMAQCYVLAGDPIKAADMLQKAMQPPVEEPDMERIEATRKFIEAYPAQLERARELLAKRKEGGGFTGDEQWALCELYQDDLTLRMYERAELLNMRAYFPEHRWVTSGRVDSHLVESYFYTMEYRAVTQLAPNHIQEHPGRRDVKSGQASWWLAESLLGIGDYRRARSAYQQLIADYPTFGEVSNGRAARRLIQCEKALR